MELSYAFVCYGRNKNRDRVLKKAAKACIKIRTHSPEHEIEEPFISLLPECAHNCGSHGQYCMAAEGSSHHDKIRCAYSCDVPYCFDVE